MTLQELCLEVYREAGEPSDLAPYTWDNFGVPTFDTAQALPGTQQLIALVNRAYLKLCAWKQPGGSIIRFKELNAMTWMRVASRSVVLTSVSGDLLSVVAAAGTFVQVNCGMYLNIGTVTRMIVQVSTDGSTVYADKAWPVGTVAGSATLFARHFPMRYGSEADAGLVPVYVAMLPNRRAWTIQWVQNQSIGSQDVQPRPRSLRFKDVIQTQAVPTLWDFTERGLEFDVAPSDGHVFQIAYYAEPAPLVGWTDVPMFPQAWHEVVWMIASWLRTKQDKNLDEANAMLKDINITVAALVQENERAYDYTNARAYILGEDR